ncbi:MAG: 1-acyl-sn-glycerol-3-phosphate acyltransferase [Bacteroidales bacterium]|nr:1-acyl-sn-glycerol-3-phosphate acyltransferase [Bacteroidales bacterium]
MGWEIFNYVSPDIKKCVVIIAPHTSMLDFVIGRLAFSRLKLKTRFLIKKELFFFPMGILLKWLGAVPVDRKEGLKSYSSIKKLFEEYESLYLTITPEATRKLTPKWKKGFYYIAMNANVPLVLGYLDYKLKKGGIEKTLIPSGDYQKDFAEIEKFYRGITAKHPENFNLSE